MISKNNPHVLLADDAIALSFDLWNIPMIIATQTIKSFQYERYSLHTHLAEYPYISQYKTNKRRKGTRTSHNTKYCLLKQILAFRKT